LMEHFRSKQPDPGFDFVTGTARLLASLHLIAQNSIIGEPANDHRPLR